MTAKPAPSPHEAPPPPLNLSQIAGWIGLACVVAAMCVFAVLQTWEIASTVLAGLGGILIVAWVVLGFDVLKKAFGTRKFQLGANTVVMGIIALGALGISNAILKSWATRSGSTPRATSNTAWRTRRSRR